MIEINKIYNEDCLLGMREIADGSVDVILTDPPYNTTQLKWDKKIDVSLMMGEFLRIIKDNGAIIITSMFPFSVDLINGARKYFRYDLIWEKDKSVGYLNANKMPLRAHEHILVFYKHLPVYNPQKTPCVPYHRERKEYCNLYRKHKPLNSIYTSKHPRSVLKFETPKCLWGRYIDEKIVHPTQKPEKLFEFLIKSYSNENDVVFDPFIGSGTTAIAAIKNNRNFIGFEIDKEYYYSSIERLGRLT